MKYLVWLSKLNVSLKYNVVKDLLDKYKEPKKIWKLTKKELLQNYKSNIVDEILDKKKRENLGNEVEYIIKNNIKLLPIYDKLYPKKLKHISCPPIVLYVKGNINILNQENIAIVGTRNCSKYGQKSAEYFSYNLAKNNINIVSGLARGIDTYSHMGAISAKGKTIAVIGNGIDICYPYENEELYKEIIRRDGVIISEYPLRTRPEAENFPRRNRIISGLSNGVLVIEARKKSGTIITVDYALQQGKEVYVVPGNINSINSVGTNELIKQGAKMVTNVREILEDF